MSATIQIQYLYYSYYNSRQNIFQLSFRNRLHFLFLSLVFGFSVLLVEESSVPGENKRPAASH